MSMKGVPNVRRAPHGSALRMVVVVDVHFLVATKEPETSFSVLRMEVGSVANRKDAQNQL